MRPCVTSFPWFGRFEVEDGQSCCDEVVDLPQPGLCESPPRLTFGGDSGWRVPFLSSVRLLAGRAGAAFAGEPTMGLSRRAQKESGEFSADEIVDAAAKLHRCTCWPRCPIPGTRVAC